MTEVTRYALWLLPGEEVSTAFADLIERLSQSYRGPRFAPHVTLLGWVTGTEEALAQTTAQLATQLDPFKLRPVGLDGEPYYFRCFYLKLDQSEALLRTHEKASTMFNAGHSSDYLPHLSLIYGQLSAPQKTRLQGELTDILSAEFIADRLQLVHITVSVADWRVVTTCPLGAPA
jgi:2'-5' RNA ligase